MNDDLSKADREAVEAAANAKQLELITAVLQAQQLVTQQQAPACHHAAPKASLKTGQWAGIAVAGSVAAISLALSAIAIAVGAVAVTGRLLVLRSMWRDYQRNS
ncbi:hypothetical protein [Streptomyces sp. NBC_00996]|uniref:hypothetical protein n=1 Tax=Streptomyces sp. NBC_00996 TaxID=2903710 RepID=UPI0038631727|nr:hypothetical protein OG390_15495 [Streptomyces sp. NBC_00996]